MLKKKLFFFFSKRGATERYKSSNSIKSIILNRLFWQHNCGHNFSMLHQGVKSIMARICV